ncbi:MAG: LysM peptidoglycan-binding domain-containing protein [Bacteroidota bacterium]
MLFIRSFIFSFCLLAAFFAQAQEIEVPSTIEFAGIKLKVDSDAREVISKNIWLLKKNEAYFNTTLERFDLYLPVLERVLAEEGLPDDFKYLALQESSLVSDVVSSSNAVGFWQFKQASAMEVGMRVDDEVDERKHIIASTRGATKYIKRNNYYLQNWLSSLLSHYAGLTGTRNLLSADWMNATKLDLDKNTHWYILKFLAHKVAFEQSIGHNPQPNLVLLEHSDTNGKTLKQVAKELDVDAEQLVFYNKWLSGTRIPENKPYVVLVPAPVSRLNDLIAKTGSSYRPLGPNSVVVASVEKESVVTVSTGGAVFPVLKKQTEDRLYTINGKAGVQAKTGDTPQRLADFADIRLEKFLKYNDLKSTDRLVPGQVYYLKKKRNQATVEEHVVIEGETLWEVSQRYGLTMKALLKKNRMAKVEKLKHGRVLCLQATRPSNKPVEVRYIPKPASAVMVAQNKPVPKAPTPVKNIQSDLPMEKEDLPVTPVISQSPKVAATTKPVVNTPVEKKEETPKVEEKALYTTTSATPSYSNKLVGKIHTVEQGQTLYAISRLYGAAIADIRAWNGLAATDGVQIGQTLLVSKPVEKADTTSVAVQAKPVVEEFTNYTVQPGDTVYKISRAYGVTVKELLSWNGKTEATLAMGEVLKVKKAK